MTNTLMSFAILICEDEDEAREALEKIVSRWGIKTYAAKDGSEGLDLFKSNTIHAVLTDIKMPNMDGLTMIGEIKKLSPDTPVIVMTAFNDVEYILQR